MFCSRESTNCLITISDEYYIQLRIWEQRISRNINYEYFYEEFFLIKHKSKHNCYNAIFFDIPNNIIESNCKFHYDFHIKVTASILDLGSK